MNINSTRRIRRGQVYYADLGNGMGSEMAGERPVNGYFVFTGRSADT